MMINANQQLIISRIQQYMLVNQGPPPLHLDFLTKICGMPYGPEFMVDLSNAWAFLFGVHPSLL
jgi:hypothetical protein